MLMVIRHNILLIIDCLKAAGAQKYVLDIAANLPTKKFCAYIAIFGSIDDNFIKGFNVNKNRIYRFPAKKILNLNSFLVIYRLIRFIKSHNIKIVHLNTLKAEILGGFAAIMAKCAIVLTRHNILPRYRDNFLKESIFRILQRIIIHTAQFVIAPSKAVKYFLLKQRKIPAKKVNVIYHGIDLQKYAFKPKELQTSVHIGMIARFRPVKGHIYLIQALPQILSTLRTKKICLHFAGDGKLYDSLVQQVKKQNLSEYVDFQKVAYDIPAFLSNLDILINATTVGEGFGYVIVEGMASGNVVVATNTGSAPEIIQHNYNGILVQPKSSVSIAKAVIRLVNSPNLFMRISRNAIQSSRPLFSISRMVDETAQLFQQILVDDEKD